MPPSSSTVVPLPLSVTSKLRQLSESTTSDNSPGKSVSDRTRKKTNGSEITEEDWKMVKAKLANGKEVIAHRKVQGSPPDKNRASVEEYVTECENAMETGKEADLPKVLQSQLQESQSGMENRALSKARTPSKVDEPKSAMASNAKTITIIITTLAKTSPQKEKDVKVQHQKEEEKQDKALARRNAILWKFHPMRNPVPICR